MAKEPVQQASGPVFRGIIPPLVTPLAGRDRIDEAGLERLIEHVLGGGVHGLFILGTTGEGPSLSHALRRNLIERVCSQVQGRVPVLVGITDAAFAESIRMAEHAAACGADALVSAPPFYFQAGQAELQEYFQHLVPELPLPLMLYNMPGCTKIAFEPATLKALLALDNVAGLKDSSADMRYFHQVRPLFAARPDLSLLIGPEDLLAEALLFGAHGGVSGGANLFPELYVGLYEAACARDLAALEAHHAQVIRIVNTIYSVGHYSSSILKGIKCALDLMEICSDFLAEPFHRFREAEREQVQQHLDELRAAGLGVQGPRQPAPASALASDEKDSPRAE